jgi:RimJ/RimL family protein N-acetyltransferase
VRGTGRGRELLKAVLARTWHDHGPDRVWLDVKAHNLRARRLYETEGFTLSAILPGGMSEPDGTATDLS